jgi:3-mercaptopyruvate sulfurtransferase SseA
VFAAGYPAWKKVAGATPAAAAVAVKAGSEEGTIDIATFEKIMQENPSSIMLIDVRDKDEFEKGSIKGAVNIPVDQLEAKIPSLPADKPVVFVCGTGARSGESYYMVQDVRPELKKVYYIEGELMLNEDGSFKINPPAP